MAQADAGLPEAVPVPVARRLLEVARRVAPPEIEELWIFPPLPDVEDSSDFLVFTRREEDGRLRLFTARRRGGPAPGPGEDGEADPRGGGPEGAGTAANSGEVATSAAEEVTAHGAVPADRVARLLERFQRRVGVEHEPVHVSLGGSERRWAALVRLASADGPADDPAAATGAAEPAAAAGAREAGDIDGGGTTP